MTSSKSGKADGLTIRPARPGDRGKIHTVVSAAFDQPDEADLLDSLRECGALFLERVAEDVNGSIVGHIAISRVTGAGAAHRLAISCLAPLSVLPSRQRQGIGGQLTRAAMTELLAKEEDLALVVGDPAYYRRFGFDPALAQLVKGPYAGDAFMALALSEAVRDALPVEVTFATPFEAFE